MDVNDKLRALTDIPPEKETPVRICWEAELFRAGLYAVEKSEKESNPCHSEHSLSLYRLSYPNYVSSVEEV
jgi:hypothetical protein